MFLKLIIFRNKAIFLTQNEKINAFFGEIESTSRTKWPLFVVFEGEKKCEKADFLCDKKMSFFSKTKRRLIFSSYFDL